MRSFDFDDNSFLGMTALYYDQEIVNKKVINLAKRVEKQASIYKKQLFDCKNSLSTNKYIVF